MSTVIGIVLLGTLYDLIKRYTKTSRPIAIQESSITVIENDSEKMVSNEERVRLIEQEQEEDGKVSKSETFIFILKIKTLFY